MESTRHVVKAGLHVELVAYGQQDGFWEARVAAWSSLFPTRTAGDLTINWSAVQWPSVNGPTSARALDALEAELREVLANTRTRYLGLYERRGS